MTDVDISREAVTITWRDMATEKAPHHTPVLLAQDWHGRRWVSFTSFISDEQVALLSKPLPTHMRAVATDHPVITHWAFAPELPAVRVGLPATEGK